VELDDISETTLEILRTEAEKIEFAEDKPQLALSWLVLLLLLSVQISN
jgi:hypothetical protein